MRFICPHQWLMVAGIGFLLTLTLGAQEWYDHYDNARDLIAESKWEAAIRELQSAVGKKSNPQTKAETTTLRYITYVPYYWLGVAYYNLGKYQKARENFRKSYDYWGVVKNTRFAQSIKTYLALVEKQVSLSDSLQQLTRTLEDSLRRSQGKIARLQRQIAELSRKSTSSSPAENPLKKRFEQGLREFVAGNYRAALASFRWVQAQAPHYPDIRNWIRRAQLELERLGKPPEPSPPSPDTVVVQVPVPVSGAPPSIGFKLEESIFRSDSILISGTVKDDIGLDRIEFVVNGEVYRNAAGDTVHIRPVSAEQARELPFSVTLPLRVGENQIAIVAYDRDPIPKQSSHLETVYRRPPFYRQPLFWWSAALFLGLVVIAVGINEVLKRRVALVEKYNPYIAGAPIRNERMFFGREELLRRILNTIHSNSLMIYGPRRIGKTSLLHQVKKRLEKEQDERYFYLPVYIDLEGTPEDKLFATMMMDIVEECQRHLDDGLALRIFEASEEYTARDFSADVKRILSHLREHFGKQVKLVLLMDEVDELNSYSERINQRLRSVFMKTFAEDLVAVMSGSFIRKHWESEGSPWYNFFEEIKVGPISTEEALKLIREPVKGIFKYEERAVKKILEYSENVPYRIQKFCVNVVARAIEQRRRRITARDVEAVKARVLEGEEN